jgi:hypothetical protein
VLPGRHLAPDPGDVSRSSHRGDIRHCRNEGVAYARVYAQACISFRDLARALASPPELLLNLFM